MDVLCVGETDLRHKLRAFFLHSKFMLKEEKYTSLVDRMSPSLEAECYSKKTIWLNQIEYLRDAPQAFVIRLCANLGNRLYVPQEVGRPPRRRPPTFSCPSRRGIGLQRGDAKAPQEVAHLVDDGVPTAAHCDGNGNDAMRCVPWTTQVVHLDFHLVVVLRGICSRQGAVKTPGKCWGEDFILSSSALKDKRTCLALTYVERRIVTCSSRGGGDSEVVQRLNS